MLRRLLKDEQGVTMTEYALALFGLGLVFIGMSEVMMKALHEYLKKICLFVSLPIP